MDLPTIQSSATSPQHQRTGSKNTVPSPANAASPSNLSPKPRRDSRDMSSSEHNGHVAAVPVDSSIPYSEPKNHARKPSVKVMKQHNSQPYMSPEDDHISIPLDNDEPEIHADYDNDTTRGHVNSDPGTRASRSHLVWSEQVTYPGQPGHKWRMFDLFKLSLIYGAVQFVYAMQIGFILDYIQKFGVTNVWAIVPLAGLLTGALVGKLSDEHHFCQWRRRSFIMMGFLGSLTLLILMASINSFEKKHKQTVAVLSLLFQGSFFTLMVVPMRALIVEITPPDYQHRINIAHSLAGGIGRTFALSIIILVNEEAVSKSKWLLALCFSAIFVAGAVTMFSFREPDILFVAASLPNPPSSDSNFSSSNIPSSMFTYLNSFRILWAYQLLGYASWAGVLAYMMSYQSFYLICFEFFGINVASIVLSWGIVRVFAFKGAGPTLFIFQILFSIAIIGTFFHPIPPISNNGWFALLLVILASFHFTSMFIIPWDIVNSSLKTSKVKGKIMGVFNSAPCIGLLVIAILRAPLFENPISPSVYFSFSLFCSVVSIFLARKLELPPGFFPQTHRLQPKNSH